MYLGRTRDPSLLHGYLRGIVEEKLRAFGVSVRGKHVVADRIPGYDYAAKIAADGLWIGLLWFDPVSVKWRFRPTGMGAAWIIEQGGEPVVEAPSKPRMLKGKKISTQCSMSVDGIVLIKRDLDGSRGYGRIVELLDDGRALIKVGDAVRAKVRVLDEPKVRVCDAMKARIDGLVDRSIQLLKRYKPGYASFSGGKDSTALLVLAVKAGLRLKAVYVDTGFELPSTPGYAETICNMLSVDLVKLHGCSEHLIERVRNDGPPAVDDRWCNELLKLRPLRSFVSKKDRCRFAEGTRRAESQQRMKLTSFRSNPLVPGQEQVLPLLDWSCLDVQAFLLLNDVPLNPHYAEGFERMGCSMCPAMHSYEVVLSLERYSYIPQCYLDALFAWAESKGVDRGTCIELLKRGLLRWKRPSPKAREIASKAGLLDALQALREA